MKKREISNILKKKNAARALALMTAAAVFTASVCSYDIKAKEKEQAESEETAEEEDLLTKMLDKATNSVSKDNTETTKEETVYIISDATGKATETIVSSWLKNPDGASTLTDVSDLADIENVKGDEGFQTGSDNTITWEADGSDIYYQGTATREAPIDVNVSYYLNDKEVTPQEIAGKSGKVRIRFDYTNTEKQTIRVNDKDEEVYVPFTVVTGMILPVENFTNVSVTNGKVISEGNNNIVVGLAFPGLEDSLDVENAALDLPDYVEVTANAENFELTMTLSVAMSDILDTIDISGDLDFDGLTDKMDDLTDATGQLVDGSGKLADGTKTLKEGTSKLADGANTLNSKKTSLTTGANQLATGINQYAGGVGQLKDGIYTLKKGTAQLKKKVPALIKGVDQLKTGSASAKAGADQLVAGYEGDGTPQNPGAVAGAKQVAAGAAQLNAGVKQLAGTVGGMGSGMAAQINAAEDQVRAQANAKLQAAGINATVGVKGEGLNDTIAYLKQQRAAASGVSGNDVALVQLNGTIETLTAVQGQIAGAIEALEGVKATINSTLSGDSMAGLQQLLDGAASLETGAASVSTGVQALYNGTKQLDTGLGDLDAGLGKLQGSSSELSKGVTQLDNGAGQLKEGVDELAGNSPSLVNGGAALLSGTVQVSDAIGQIADGANGLNKGAGDLNSGANELSDGIVRFNEEGIERLTGALDGTGDVTNVIDRLKAVKDAGKNYQSFSGIADGAKGSVKFIIKTDAIKAE